MWVTVTPVGSLSYVIPSCHDPFQKHQLLQWDKVHTQATLEDILTGPCAQQASRAQRRLTTHTSYASPSIGGFAACQGESAERGRGYREPGALRRGSTWDRQGTTQPAELSQWLCAHQLRASITSLCERRKRGDCDTQEDVQTRAVTTTTTEAHTGTQSCHYLGLSPGPPPFSGPPIHLSLTPSCPSPTLHIPICLATRSPAIHLPPSHLSIC